MAREFQTEEEVDEYFDERQLRLQAQYESRIRDIDSQIIELDDKLQTTETLYDHNAELAQQRERLMDEYAQQSEGITLMERDLEIKRNRYQMLDTLFAETEDREQREEVRQQAIQTANEIQDLKTKIDTAKRQDYENKAKTWDEVQKVNTKIIKNTNEIEKTQKLEDKQNNLVSKRDSIVEKFDSDIDKNERQRQKAKDKLPKTVPDRVVDIQGYGWTDYCYGDRIITIPISFQARIPDGMTVQDLQNDVLKEMANNAFAYLIDAGENVPGAGMSWSFDKPTGKGDYHFDARGISYNHPEVLTPDFDGYILTPDGYVRKK